MKKILCISFVFSQLFFLHGTIELHSLAWDDPGIVIELKKLPPEELSKEQKDALRFVEEALKLARNDSEGSFTEKDFWMEADQKFKTLIERYRKSDDIQMKRLVAYSMGRRALIASDSAKSEILVDDFESFCEGIKDDEIRRIVLELELDLSMSGGGEWPGSVGQDMDRLTFETIIVTSRMFLNLPCIDEQEEESVLAARYLTWLYGFRLCYGNGNSQVARRVYREMKKRYGESTNPRIQSCLIRAISTKAKMGISCDEYLQYITWPLNWSNYQLKFLFDGMVKDYGNHSEPIIQEAVSREITRYLETEFNPYYRDLYFRKLCSLYGDSLDYRVLKHVIKSIVEEVENRNGNLETERAVNLLDESLNKYSGDYYKPVIWPLIEIKKIWGAHTPSRQ